MPEALALAARCAPPGDDGIEPTIRKEAEMAFACCASCGSAESDPSVLDYGEPAGSCPSCGGRMTWMATPFALRILEDRRYEPGTWEALHRRRRDGMAPGSR